MPLNVVEGGLASPNDTDPTIDRYDGPSDHKCGCPDCKAQKSEVQYKAEPLDEESREFADTFAKFFERQARSVLPKIRAAKAAGALAKDADDWWDVTRWDKELAADLEVIARGQSDIMARRALQAIGVPDDEYDPDEASAFLADMCRVRAEYVNATTRAQLERSLELEAAGAEGLMATPDGVFENAVENRTESAGAAIAAAVDGWSALEAVRQCAPDQDIRKRWVVTSSNPRPTHAAMNGETVPYAERFSNGAMWPGDTDALDAEEVANCQCAVTIEIP